MNTSKIVTDAINHPVEAKHPDNPYHVYRATARRMANEGSPAEREASKHRWPTVAYAHRDMVAAFAAMSDEDRADDLAQAKVELDWIAASF